MSSRNIIRLGLMAGSSVAMLGLTACASSGHSTRYGGYDYEAGQNCGAACVAPAPVYTAPAPVTSFPVSPGPVYVDCTQVGTCGSVPAAPTTVYTAPSTSYGGTTYSSGMADCPVGTTLQSDGTCMQGGSSSYSSSVSSYTTSTYSGDMADCPAGTTLQSDGTCMQGGSYSSTTSSTYYPPAATPASCPSGSVMQADGSCSYGYTSTGTTDYRPIRK
ncbi:MAG: hypothetical protein WBF53_00260 [Litorimonas sp.]